MGWSPAPQAHLFLPLHHHHVAHQSRTRALMDLKTRSQRMFEMWFPKDSRSVWNPYYHWDLLKFYLLCFDVSWHCKLPTWGDHVRSFMTQALLSLNVALILGSDMFQPCSEGMLSANLPVRNPKFVCGTLTYVPEVIESWATLQTKIKQLNNFCLGKPQSGRGWQQNLKCTVWKFKIMTFLGMGSIYTLWWFGVPLFGKPQTPQATNGHRHRRGPIGQGTLNETITREVPPGHLNSEGNAVTTTKPKYKSKWSQFGMTLALSVVYPSLRGC